MANDQGQITDPPTKRPDRVPTLPPRSSISWYWYLLLALFGSLLLWAYWPTLLEICAVWTSNADYTHGFFVIPISLWLLWARRRQAPQLSLSIDWRGLLLIAAAGMVRVIAGRFYLPQFDAWSIPLWVGGVVWLLFGWAVLKWALPSIAFLWFATPLPGSIEIVLSTPLQRVAASLSTFALRIIGQPAIVEGTTILLDDHVLDVEQACSGLRMFYGIFALAFACVALARPPRWRAVLVLLAAAPIAIFANVLRIVTTGILLKFASNEAAQKFSHDLAGIVMIPFAVVLFLVFLLMLGRIVARLEETGGVAWLTKWGLGVILVAACTVAWGRHQGTRAITTLRDASARYEAEQNWGKSIQYLTRYIRATPDDQDAFSHLADIYRTHATSYPDQSRAVELLQAAWQRQPAREDFAISAIQIAMGLQKFDEAVQLSAQLLSRTSLPHTRATATKLWANSLVAYLQSDENRGDYTWENAKDALEKALQQPDYEIAQAQILAEVYRQRLTSAPVEEREKLADQLIDRIVKERAADPRAWLARHQYRLRYGDQSKEALAKADRDLARALELVDKQPQNPAGVSVLLAAASRAQARGNTKRPTEFLERAIKMSPADFRAYLALAELKRKNNTKEGRDEAIHILREGNNRSGQHDLYLTLALATLLAENGDFDKAEAEIAPLEKVIPYVVGVDRGANKLRVGLIRTQIINSRDGAQPALTYLRQLMDEPDVRLSEQRAPQTLAQGHAVLASLYAILGAPDLALDAYRQAVRIEPTKNEWQLQAAALAQQAGDFEAADRDYRALIQAGGATAATRAALVEVEIQRQLQRGVKDRDMHQAQRMLDTAQQAGASPIMVRLLQAEILAASGESEKAEQNIVQLTKDFPKDKQAWRALAVFCHQHSNTTGALQAADRFAEMTDQGVESAALRASVLAESNRVDEAVDGLSKSLAAAPSDQQPQAAIALARLLNQVGRHAESYAVLEPAHDKSPHNLQIIDTLANMAWLDQDWKKLEKYESWLQSVEGNEGTLWKAYRAQRLLATARSIQDQEFQEVIALADVISRERPRWSKAHFLQGEIAFRMNRVDASAAAYERAWNLGGRGILLADRLIDLLTRQGRFDNARQYVAQIRDYLAYSQGLFDRAIPYLATGNESQEMTQLAQQWVKQNPKDSEAHLRLGRVLLMLSESLPPEEKKKYVARAESEFRSAIDLAPNDVRPWAASVLLYGEAPETRDRALHVLEDFAKQDTINKLQRDFVLAQLYDYLGQSSRAQYYFQQAATSAEADPKSVGAADVLGRAAQFYLPRVPALAEVYARAALAQKPANSDARLVLVYLLANRSDQASVEEALRLLDDGATKDSMDPSLELRLRAALLAQRGGPKDIDSAIEVLQHAISQGREDKLLLARLYERSGQIPPALELLETLARAPNAQAGELTEYLRFWQQHFLNKSDAEAGTQFAGKANDIYRRLGALPGQMPELLRWQIRALKARNPKGVASSQDVVSVVADVRASSAAQKLNEQDAKLLFQQILVVLLQEECDDAAFQLTTAPPKPLSNVEAAVWLCHSYVAVPKSPESNPKQLQAMEKLQAAHSDNPNVLQAIGDCSFLAGKYEKAIEAYQRVLALAPEHAMARNNLALALAELPDKMAEARQVLSVALQFDAANADLLDTQATLDIIDKHPQQAIPVLEKIAAQNPDSPVLRLHLAIAYDDSQNADRARDNMFTAVALGVGQRILSPRDKQSLQALQSRYIDSKMTAKPDDHSANNQVTSKRSTK